MTEEQQPPQPLAGRRGDHDVETAKYGLKHHHGILIQRRVKPCKWWAPWRHYWKPITRVWWSVLPPGWECSKCGKREWLEP